MSVHLKIFDDRGEEVVSVPLGAERKKATSEEESLNAVRNLFEGYFDASRTSPGAAEAGLAHGPKIAPSPSREGERGHAIRPAYRFERVSISEERRAELISELAAFCQFSSITVDDVAAAFEVPIPVFLDHVHSDWIVRIWGYSREFAYLLVKRFGRAKEDEIAGLAKEIADYLWTLRTGKPVPADEEDA